MEIANEQSDCSEGIGADAISMRFHQDKARPKFPYYFGSQNSGLPTKQSDNNSDKRCILGQKKKG